MYEIGVGVPLDAVEAVKWFRLSADQGYPKAQNNLGMAYDTGTGVPHDAVEAATWFRLAANQGEALAQVNLGKMYATGEGVPKDIVLAHMWFTVSSTGGNQDADGLRDLAETLMTPAQIADATQRAKACMNSDYADCGYGD